MNGIKSLIRLVLIFFHIDITKNIKYDRLTKKIIKKHFRQDFSCIDVGCHKGEILREFIHFAPKGKHYAFEPIPVYYDYLIKKFEKNSNIKIFPYALSDESKSSSFHYVKNAPAYSGIKKRRYDIKNPEIEKIEVDLHRLDDILAAETKIDFVKIDVEGAEMLVIKGGKNLIRKNKPMVLFECGIGGSDYYGTKAEDIFCFFQEELDLKISLLQSFIKKKQALSLKEFSQHFTNNTEYYFIAHP